MSGTENPVKAAAFIGVCVAAILILLLHANAITSIGIGFLAALITVIALLVL